MGLNPSLRLSKDRKVQVEESALKLFWYWVCERHNIFLRRVVQKLLPPWTKDLVLSSVYFTPPYRELDRLTRYLILNILPHIREDPNMVIFNIWVYRFFNLIETFECLGGYSNYWDKGQARGTLFQRQQQGQKIYTGAFMVNSAGSRPGPGGKLDLTIKAPVKIFCPCC